MTGPLPLLPAGPDDADDVLALFAVYDLVEFGLPQMDLDDVLEPFAEPGTRAVAVREAGRLVGYAHLTTGGDTESLVEPGRADLHARLLHWVVAQAYEMGTPRLVHWAGAAPGAVAAPVLTAVGFTHARTLWRLAREHDGSRRDGTPVASPVWPDGVTLVPFDRARDARAVHALLQRAFDGTFGSRRRSFEEWERGSLDRGADALVAVRAGVPVAAALHAVRLGEGYVVSLGVDLPSRGQGLARALLHEAFQRDVAHGRPRTALTVDGENASARRLYESVGMHVVEEYRRWERTVGPG